MKKQLLDLETEIIKGQENAKNAKELYQLLSSYNAYSILLLKIQQEYERKKTTIKEYYFDSYCYKKQTANLFSQFKSDEYLSSKIIGERSLEDMLFLIDQNTLLRIYSFDIMDSTIDDLSHIDYNLIKINDCKGKIYKQSFYCRDPYYCDSHWEDKYAFGFFCNGSLITPSYVFDSKFYEYDNIDIREILKVQSIDDIHQKINESKNIKTKKLILTK